MKKILILILTLATFVTACQQKQEPSTPQQKPVIKIGAILPLTGDAGFLGEGIKNGITMAWEYLPKTHFNYQIVFEDDQMDPKKTAVAAQKLIHTDKVDFLISASSGTGNVITPIAEQNKVVHFGIASDAHIADGKYNFIHWTQPQEEARALAEVLQEKKLHRIAAFIFNQQGTQAILNKVKEAIQSTDIQIVYTASINPGERDFRIMLNKAKVKKPDVYFLSMLPPEMEILAKQFKELHIEQPLIAIESFGFSSTPEIFNGRWFIDAADMSPEMIEKFQSKYDQTSMAAAGNGYDIIKMIAHVCENSDTKPTSDEAVSALLNIKDFQGAMGKISVDPDGIIQSKASLKEMQNGKPVTIKRFE